MTYSILFWALATSNCSFNFIVVILPCYLNLSLFWKGISLSLRRTVEVAGLSRLLKKKSGWQQLKDGWETYMPGGCRGSVFWGMTNILLYPNPATRLYSETLSMRKQFSRNHDIWLIDGVLQPCSGTSGFKGPCKGFMSNQTVCSTGAQHLETKRITPNSRVLGTSESVRWPECYAEGRAKHLGVSVMPRNPFRDVMAHRWGTSSQR